MKTPWRIEMFGGLQAFQSEQIITRFQTQKNALLLAYLACHMDRPHSRDVLIDMLWPDVELEIGRNRLRQALASLRRQIEPPELPPKSILITDRVTARLNPEAVTTDVSDFQAALLSAARTRDPDVGVRSLVYAVELYQGELLPGYYAEWISVQRERLHKAAYDALHRLVGHHEKAGDYGQAREYAYRMVRLDPLNESGHHDMIRLSLLLSQPAIALRQYRALERLLHEELGQSPSGAARNLFKQALEFDTFDTGVCGVAPAATTVAEAPPLARAQTHKIVVPTTAVTPSADIHLPIQFTRFFGRETEVTQLLTLLPAAHHAPTGCAPLLSERFPRLITLTGPGGCGKTRLAIEAARQYGIANAVTVRFVSLDHLTDPRQIPAEIAHTLGVRLIAETEALPQLIQALSEHPTLLLLDNMEQLLGVMETEDNLPGRLAKRQEFTSPAADLVHELLGRLPSLVCLITSRQRLNIAGEQEFPLLPLPVPVGKDAVSSLSASSLLSFPSVQMFVDRAQAIRPDFQVTPRTAPIMAKLMMRLEGLPLAIELAAAWTQTLTPAQMLERLDHRFELLVSRRNDLPPRHRALCATVEWSYRLLPRDLQEMFACLSIFRNGWTYEAAEAVCLYCAGWSLDSLNRLRSRSFIFTAERGEEMRWQMLETLREFAAEQITEETRAELARRHARHYLQFAEQLAPLLPGAQQERARLLLDMEWDNLYAAFEWTLAHAPELALRLAGALWRYWALTGQFREGRVWLDRALQAAQQPAAAFAVALNGAGILAQHQSDHSIARDLFEQAQAIYRRDQDQAGIANTLNNLGRLAYSQGDYEAAQAHYQASLTLWRELDAPHSIAITLNNLGLILREQQAYAAAAALMEESLLHKRQSGDRQGIAITLNNLGLIAHDQGDYTAAAAYYQESLIINCELGNRSLEATSLHNLARVLLAQTDLIGAAGLLARGLTIRNEVGDRHGIAFSLEGGAELAVIRHHDETAARLFGAASALRETIDAPLPRPDHAAHHHALAQARTKLGNKRFDAVYHIGCIMPLEQTIDHTLDFLRSVTEEDRPARRSQEGNML